MDAGDPTGDPYEPVDDSVKVLATMIVNRGRYSITRIEARASPDGKNLISHHQFRRLAGFDSLPDRLRSGLIRLGGMRFETDRIHVSDIAGPYPVVQMDRRWEHRKGDVRRIGENTSWS